MMAQLPEAAIVLATPDPVAKYRELRSIAETGPMGAETRRRLIADYMQVDGTKLPDDVKVTTHGAGEHAFGQETDVTGDDGLVLAKIPT